MTKTDKIKANKELGNKIVQALNEYKQVQGHFPENLEMLEPDYLSEIPKTIEDDDFTYILLDGEQPFFLSFRIGGQPTCSYIHQVRIWDCTPGIDH